MFKRSPGKQQSADGAGGQEGRRAVGFWLSRGSQGLCPMWMWASPAASWTQTARLWGPKHEWPPTKCTHMVAEPQGNQSIADPLAGPLNIWEIFWCIFLSGARYVFYQCVCWFGDVMGLNALPNLLELNIFSFSFSFFGGATKDFNKTVSEVCALLNAKCQQLLGPGGCFTIWLTNKHINMDPRLFINEVQQWWLIFFFWGGELFFFVFCWKTNEKRNFNEIGDAVQMQKNKWSNDLELTRMLSGQRAARFSRVEPQDGFISSKKKEPKKYRGVLPSCCFGQLGGRRRSCFAYIDWIKNAKSVTKSLEICFLFSTCVFSFATPQFLNI